MKRQICMIVLLLLGAVLAGVIIGYAAGRAPGTVSIRTQSQPFQSGQLLAAQSDFSKWAQSHQTVEQPRSQASPIYSNSTLSPASARPPVATNILAETDEHLFYKISDTNPAVAVKLAAQLDPSLRPAGLMENLIQRWADADLLAAAAWVEGQTTGDEQERLLQRVGFTLSQTEPAQAAEFVTTQIPAGPVQDEAVMTVVNQWGNQNMAAAASWVQTFPEGPLQERAVEELEGIEQYQRELAQQ